MLWKYQLSDCLYRRIKAGSTSTYRFNFSSKVIYAHNDWLLFPMHFMTLLETWIFNFQKWVVDSDSLTLEYTCNVEMRGNQLSKQCSKLILTLPYVLQGLLAKSCLCPGFATLVSNLITSSNVEAQVLSWNIVLHLNMGSERQQTPHDQKNSTTWYHSLTNSHIVNQINLHHD